MAFSSLGKILGEGSTTHFPPALSFSLFSFFLFFFSLCVCFCFVFCFFVFVFNGDQLVSTDSTF